MGIFPSMSEVLLQAGCGKRRERGHVECPGATAGQQKQFHAWERGLEGQRCCADAAGAACEGEGQKSTLSEQEMPGAAPPVGAGATLLLLKVVR